MGALYVMREFKLAPTPSHPTPCNVAPEGSSVEVGCSDGVISSVDFASFGTPSGDCAVGFQKSTSCHAASSQTIVEKACLDKKFCVVPANIDRFGDPCFGK